MKEAGAQVCSENSQATGRQGFEETCRFIDALVRAWQLTGVSSRTMVISLSNVVSALGLHGDFVATPDYVQTVVSDKGDHQQHLNLSVSRSGNYSLTKLTQIMAVANAVENGSLSPSKGLDRLREIMAAPDEYSSLVNALAFMLCGICFGAVIGASWREALLGGLFSLVSFGITLVSARSGGIAALQELLSAMIVVILSSGIAMLLPSIDPLTVTFCAVVWFIPGFGLTIAPRELMMGNTLSGIIWFTKALMVMLKLLGGMAIGLAISTSAGMMVVSAASADAIPRVWNWVTVPGLIISLAVLMKVNWRAFGGIFVGGILAWGTLQIGNEFGAWQGTFFGTALLIIYGDWHSHRFRIPSVVILLPCIMILVPGFAALHLFHTASAEGLTAGIRAAYSVFILISAIIGGALVGDALAVNRVLKTGKTFIGLLTKR